MMRIVDYKLVSPTALDSLERVVNEFIADGYEPQGGPFCGSYNKVYQAMGKREEIKTKPVKKKGGKA